MAIQLLSLKFLGPIGVALVILVAIIWILYLKNKKFAKEIVTDKNKIKFYKTQIENLNKENDTPINKLKKISKISRGYFKEAHEMGRNLTYLELAKQFDKLKKPEYAKFCRELASVKYSGKAITTQKITVLSNQLTTLLSKE